MRPSVEYFDDDRLLLKVPDPHEVVERIAGATLHGKGALVPWDLATSRRLSALGISTISPMTRDYDFPSYKRKVPNPRNHQVKIADFLVRHRKGFCFGDIGVGKTLSALWAADYLMMAKDIKRVLVVCPLSIVNESWGDSIKAHFPRRSYTVLHANTPAKRLPLAKTKTDFHIVNFDGVHSIKDQLKENDYDLVIVDESTAYKNPSTARWKSLRYVLGEDAGLWLMSGTPVPQGPMDAFGQAKLVGSRGVPKTQMQFKIATMRQVTQYKWVPRKESGEIVRKALSPAIHVDKRAVLKDLPAVTALYRQVDMTSGQKKAFELMRRDMQLTDAGTTITAVNAAVKLLKLMQIAAGVVYDDEGDIVEFDNKPRINEMLSLIEQSASKTVVYVPFRHVLTVVQEALEKAGHKVAVIYGDVPKKQREEIFKSFQSDDKYDVLLAIPNAMAHGITATAASTVIWFMPQMRHEIYTQASGRVDRIGQKLPVTIAHIYGHPVEKELYQNQQEAVGYERKLLALYNKLIGGNK